jgi:RNA polymerase sigma factor (TIGR02999 family)
MRRILVENARRKQSLKRGGAMHQQPLSEAEVAAPDPAWEILALDEALERLESQDPQAAALVKLRYFSGLTVPQAAEALDVSPRTAERLWTFAKAWLYREMQGETT